MPIRMIARNGPPEAMICPAILCSVCLEPVTAKNGAAYWFSYGYEQDSGRAIESEVEFAHKGRCFSVADHRNEYGERALLMDLDLNFFLKQLVNNFKRGFREEENVEYVAPVPSRWRIGNYERQA